MSYTNKRKSPARQSAQQGRVTKQDQLLRALIEHAPRPPEDLREMQAYGNTDAWFNKYREWFNAAQKIK